MKSKKEQNIVLRPLIFLLGFLLTLLIATTASAQVPSKTEPPKSFRDCPDCPEMNVLPTGSFMMGANVEASKKAGIPNFIYKSALPQHSVSVKSFAIAKYDVTKGEFAKFVQETGYIINGCNIYIYKSQIFNLTGWVDDSSSSWQRPGFEQSDQHPVVCVSWDDAQHFVAWLNGKLKSKYHYRLPSEAEWEYAARAGTATLRYWGEDSTKQCEFANGRDQSLKDVYKDWPDVTSCRDGFATTSPVGSFRPNQWGLYDMLGNVAQWVEDCWNIDYSGAPTDGHPWTSEDCSKHVTRGAGWTASQDYLVSFVRSRKPTNKRESITGFRLARDVQ